VVLPTSVEGVKFSRCYHSATTEKGRVGGDFIDVFEVDGPKVGISLGDVSGKGIDAAVTTSLVRTTLRVHALDGQPPARVADKANAVMRKFTETDAYVTLWFGLLNTKTGLLRYISAGHPPALVMSASGEIRLLECPDPILGAFDDACFSERRTVLASGDRLVLYSDGVTEARAPSGGFLGEDGVLGVVGRHDGEDTLGLSEAIMNDVVAFSEGLLRDDVAVLAVEPVKLRHRRDAS